MTTTLITSCTYLSTSSVTSTSTTRSPTRYIPVSYYVAPDVIGGKVTKVSATTPTTMVVFMAIAGTTTATFRSMASCTPLHSEMPMPFKMSSGDPKSSTACSSSTIVSISAIGLDRTIELQELFYTYKDDASPIN